MIRIKLKNSDSEYTPISFRFKNSIYIQIYIDDVEIYQEVNTLKPIKLLSMDYIILLLTKAF